MGTIVTRASFESGVHTHLRAANVGQKAGTTVEAATTPPIGAGAALSEEARITRTNSVLTELLKSGRAEVSDLTVRDVARLAQELGWDGEPRFEFEPNGKVFVSPPGRRRRRTTQVSGENGGQS